MSEQKLARPSKPLTESIARIAIHGEGVRVFFPEKLDHFREAARRLLYSWDAPYYSRTIKDEAARFDRAAELARDLLAAGFVVKSDEAIIQAAVSGSFTPETRRWITVGDSGQYAGWFSVRWFRDEDCYQAAKRLPGSRYDKPHVAAPPEQYEAVLDFAQRYGFKVTAAAENLAAEARAERDAAIVVDLEPVEERPLPVANGRIPQLTVPDFVEIDDELMEV